MKIHLLATFGLALICLIGHNQSKELSYYDLEIGRYFNLRPTTLNGLNWLDANTICWVENNALVKANISNPNKKDEVVTLEEVNSHVGSAGIDSLKSFPLNYSFADSGVISFQVGHKVIKYHMEENKLLVDLELPEGIENVEYSPDNKKAAYRLDRDFHLKVGDNEVEVNKSDKDGHSYGAVVHRNEFGIANGSYWSPDGQRIAYYSKDESMVSPYPVVRIDSRIASTDETYYPMAGMKSEEVKVLIYDLNSKGNVTLQTAGDPEQYLTNLSWSESGEHIYVQQLNRKQNHMHLVKYSPITGEVIDTLFEEKHEKYVEPMHPLVFSKLNPESFYYQSSRDGFNHIYYYDSDKMSLRQITKGEWIVTDFIGYDTKEEYLYFMSTEADPQERHLYKLNLDNNKITQLTKEPGRHHIQLNSDYTAFIDTYSSTTVPNIIQVKSVDGKHITEVHTSENPLTNYKLGEVKNGTFVGGDDKTKLPYRMVLPTEFNPKKKYPIIFYVYGGPHAQMINNAWVGRTELWLQYMAQKDFIGMIIDTRGSYGRGMEFENVIHRQSGIPQKEDLMMAVKFLSGKKFVDTSRIGIHGWSYGGYMTITMMTSYADVFKVGVAGGPVIDWKYYEVMYGERYMDTPEENPEGYKLTNLNNYAGNLKGKLKIIHGSVDPTVVWQHSQSFVQACIKEGSFPDLFYYPLHKHNVRGYDRVHLIELISEYFIENL